MSEEPDIKLQDPQPMGEDWTTWTTTKRGGYVGGSTLVLHLNGLRYIGLKDYPSHYGKGPQIIYGYKGLDTSHEFESLRERDAFYEAVFAALFKGDDVVRV